MNKILIYSLVIALFAFAKAESQTVSSPEQLHVAIKNVKPGDTIVMADKEWKDVTIKFKAMGTREKPIVLRAQSMGKVKLTGTSRLLIGGDYLEVHGLYFDNGNTGTEHVVRFSTDSKTLSNFSRLTNCAIVNVGGVAKDSTTYYVELSGKNNRVDHNYLAGKTNKGPTLVVRLDDGPNNQHKIDHNHFGPRPPLGMNGGETIRIGTSTYSKSDSKTLVENNFFEQCSGEMEIISIKSGRNIIRYNLLLESEGTITLRHGDYNLIEGNVIIGNYKPNVGGIRLINKGHIVQNNIVYGVLGSELRAPISIMKGVENAKLNEYDPVVDCVIQNNSIINSAAVAMGTGESKNATLVPVNTVFVNNLVYNENGGNVLELKGDMSGVTRSNNLVSDKMSVTDAGFKKVAMEMQVVNDLPTPVASIDANLEGVAASPKVRLDATGALRSQNRVGAIVPGNFKKPLGMDFAAGTSYEIGKAAIPMVQEEVSKVVNVKPGDKTLEKAVSKATGPTTFVLEAGEYTLSKGLKVTQAFTFKGAGMNATKLVIASGIEKAPQYIFRMEGGAELNIADLSIDGASTEAVKYAVSSENGDVHVPFKLMMDRVMLVNFTNPDGGALYKAYKGSYATSIEINNSIFKNTYRGFNMSYEKDEVGVVNTALLSINNTVFQDFQDYAINFLRTGSSGNQKPATLKVDHCVFYKVDDNEKGRIIESKGIDNVLISNTIFAQTSSSDGLFNLKGSGQNITNSNLYSTGPVKTSQGATQKNITNKNPKWEDEKSFKLKDSSELIGKATDGKNIGLINN